MKSRRIYPETITNEEIESYELSWFKGEIVLVEDIKTFHAVFPRLLDSGVLGFDTETKPNFRKGRKNNISLIQLATDELACLIRINKIGFPTVLADLLSNPGIVKTGVAVHDDIRYLKEVRGFEPSGFIDLQKLVKEYGIKSSGLKKLTAIVLGFRISKSQQVTNWEAEILTIAQQVYAATDAWVCYKIFKTLVNGDPELLPGFEPG